MNSYTEAERAFGESCRFCHNMREIFNTDDKNQTTRHAECPTTGLILVDKERGHCDMFFQAAKVMVNG